MSQEFSFPEEDVIGMETLESIAGADRFNEWMYQTIAPYCKGRILEIGSGIGNISKYFVESNQDLVLSDIRDNYLEYLGNVLPNVPSVKINLVDPNFETEYAEHLGTFDTVFALNVVEHIKEDEVAMLNCKKLLRENGNVIILVPAYNTIYNSFDTALEHFRRYTRSSFKKMVKNHFTIIHTQYFNFIGIAGWIVSGGILKKKSIPKGQMKLYNSLVPIFKVIDKVLFNTVGLSFIYVGQK